MKPIVPKLKRASPTILTCLGAVGVIATAVLAVKETPKAMKLIEEERHRINRDLLKEAEENGNPDCMQISKLEPIDMIKTAWKCYIPAAGVGLATIVCLFGANGLNKRQQASITGAYIFLDKAYREYKAKVKELYGEDGERQVRSEIAKDKRDQGVEEGSDGVLLFFDFFSGRYFNRSMEQVIDAEYNLNRKFVHNDYVTLNEFYDLIGLDPVDFGDSLGWSIGAGENFYNYQWVDFEHELTTMDDGMECFILHMPNPPSADFMDYC